MLNSEIKQSSNYHSQEYYTFVPGIKQQGKYALAVKMIRDRLGLTQAEFADRLGCIQNTVSRYESGKLIPSTDMLARIWKLSSQVERALLIGFLGEDFSTLEQREQEDLLIAAETDAIERRIARPTVLAKLQRIIDTYKGHPDADEIFDQASIWMETQFQIRSLKRKRK